MCVCVQGEVCICICSRALPGEDCLNGEDLQLSKVGEATNRTQDRRPLETPGSATNDWEKAHGSDLPAPKCALSVLRFFSGKVAH